ncbi:guanylate-binding protein 1-like isoform X2 [Bufo gargarizans]|uniref:guanylate-binding protein 1-like isoform X2 n=1 Tax=Bufo gargarizans TaxID=30331 RepID=UPI001CF44F07|nr:guanylate-binding protein 1-like isoform X2 [Bufo gargarizans]
MEQLMPLPVCLIENVGSNLVVNQEAEKILSSISEPVIVVSIVGKYRTGKSFLMNRLVGHNNGFLLGSSIQSKTKGIWMWCVPHPWKPGYVLVLLDTEGLGDVEKGDSKNDAWIFCLSVLLSSALVYNSIGTIDQQAIEQLHYVTELTEVIKLKSTDTKDETAEHERFLPSFTWCVRDFTLSLERDGKEITEDEYLMMGLELKTGENFQQYNLPRECIRSFFHSHKCFVFDRPTSTRNLHRLDELKESELEEEFMEQAAKFYEHIMRNSRVKALTGGITVTGKMLGNLTSLYVDTIRSGEIPCMENAVLTLAKIENAGALQDAMSKYEHEMDNHVLKFPIETELEFLNLHMECTGKANEVFMKRSVNDQDQTYLQELKNQIVKKKKEYIKINEDLSREVCKNLLQTLSLTMQNGLQQGSYFRRGGHKAFLMDNNKILENYHRTPGKGVKSQEVLEDFIHENQNSEAAILQAEEKITQADQRLAEAHNQALRAEQQRQSAEQQNRDLQQSMIRQSATFQQLINSLTGEMEQNRMRMAQENNFLMTLQLQVCLTIANGKA